MNASVVGTPCRIPETVLAIENLQLSLAGNGQTAAGDTKKLVHDVSLRVVRGKVTGLIGESGCGKSLTCLAVMGLLPQNVVQSGGRVVWAGSETVQSATVSRQLRGRKAAMIMQNPMTCFDPIFTINRHISETLQAHGLSYSGQLQRIRGTLAELGFDSPDEILGAYPFQLSGGMLQRIMVSLALLLEVELLIADEPTTDLDVIVQARILDLLDRLRRQKNMGILLVTHDLSVIARLADKVLVMQDGRVVESGPVSELFMHAQHRYTKSLLEAHFSLYGRMTGEEVMV